MYSEKIEIKAFVQTFFEWKIVSEAGSIFHELPLILFSCLTTKFSLKGEYLSTLGSYQS